MIRSPFSLIGVVTLIGILLVAVRPVEKGEPAVSVPTAADPPPRGYVCYRASRAITVDGKLDESAWADAPWSEPFRDIEGDLRPDPPLRTRMKMLWDDTALYIAAELEEPHVWAYQTKHDSVIFHENDFEVFIDPDADGHLYGEFELNARNTTWDLLLSKPYKDGGKAVDSWEIAGLKTAVRVDGTINDPTDTDRGWTLEIAWPWRSLKELSNHPVPPKDGHQWRINFSRVEWDHEVVKGDYRRVPKRPEYNWVWSPQGVIDMHRPERWGILQFSTGEPRSATLRPDPAQSARDFLHQVYYAQREYHNRPDRRYATRLAGLVPGGLAKGLADPRMEATRNTFEASVELRKPDGGRERWRINHEARIQR